MLHTQLLLSNLFHCLTTHIIKKVLQVQADEKRSIGKEYLSFLLAVSHTFSCCFWSSLCPLFCHIHFPQPGVPSSLLQAPLSPCTCYSRRNKFIPEFSLLLAFGSSSSLSGFAPMCQVRDLCFFKCEDTGKVRHINPLFIYRSGTGRATAIWDFLCCFTHPWPLQWPELLWRVGLSSNSASDQLLAQRISCGMAQICQICVVIKWNCPWSIKIWANYCHIN